MLLQYFLVLYEISVKGYIEETNKPMVEGIVNAISRAHEKLQKGNVVVKRGELLDTNINRSPQAYLLNPEEERAQYKYDVDKDMTLLSFLNENGDGIGVLSWYAIFLSFHFFSIYIILIFFFLHD